MTDSTAPEKRRIKSFVLRTGRMTPSQAKAYEASWPALGLSLEDGLLDFEVVFGNVHETILEIGFGMGDSLFQMAQAAPSKNFIGIEVHTPGVGRLLNLASEAGLKNLKVFEADAVEVLERSIQDNSLAGVQLFFPDPWHKKKHHKRRIVQPAFIELLLKKLKPQGFLHFATDWQHYAEHMLEVLEANSDLVNQANNDYIERPRHRPLTKFEKRGHRLGHGVWDLMYFKR